MNPIIEIETLYDRTVLINVNSIAAVYGDTNGNTVIVLATVNSKDSHHTFFTREHVTSVKNKIEQAFMK